jgi:transcription elongation factor Elf1
MCLACEKCNKKESNIVRVEYSQDMDMYVCGACERAFEDSVEEYEERKRRRIQEQNEY